MRMKTNEEKTQEKAAQIIRCIEQVIYDMLKSVENYKSLATEISDNLDGNSHLQIKIKEEDFTTKALVTYDLPHNTDPVNYVLKDLTDIFIIYLEFMREEDPENIKKCAFDTIKDLIEDTAITSKTIVMQSLMEYDNFKFLRYCVADGDYNNLVWLFHYNSEFIDYFKDLLKSLGF